jgi:hypothetical protein
LFRKKNVIVGRRRKERENEKSEKIQMHSHPTTKNNWDGPPIQILGRKSTECYEIRAPGALDMWHTP